MVFTFQPGNTWREWCKPMILRRKTHGFTSKNHVVNHVFTGRRISLNMTQKQGNPPTFSMVNQKSGKMPCHEVGNPSSDPPSVQSGSRQRERPSKVKVEWHAMKNPWLSVRFTHRRTLQFTWRAFWYFPSGHTQLAVLWEAVAHSQLAFVDRNSFTLAFATPFFFFKKTNPLLYVLHDSLVEPSFVVLCSSSSLEFQKTHPQHSEPPNFWKTRKRLHVFMVPSTYVGSVQTCNVSAYEHQKCQFIQLMFQKSHPANNLEMSKKPLLL